MRDLSRRLGLVVRAGSVLAAIAMAVVLWSVELGGFLLLTVLGGIVLAGAFAWANRHSRRSNTHNVPDQFARDAFSTDTLNFAHVRVAGIGGLGLVLAALAVALDFAFVAVVLGAGLAGGVFAAVAVILYRRRRGPLPSSSAGPGARRVLFTESSPTEVPRVDRTPRSPRQTAVVSI
jgi:hypothetical protein